MSGVLGSAISGNLWLESVPCHTCLQLLKDFLVQLCIKGAIRSFRDRKLNAHENCIQKQNEAGYHHLQSGGPLRLIDAYYARYSMITPAAADRLF